MTRVGFVGAGQMGRPMVERLVVAGHDVVVHSRRLDVRSELEAFGARATGHLAAAAENREIVIACLYDDRQLIEVAAAIADALPPGALFASHVTGRVATLSALARQHPAIEFIDAPISGVPENIRAGTLTVLLGCPAQARPLATAVMSAYADPIIYTGVRGTALPVKLINNLLMAVNTQLLADGIRLGSQLGVEQLPLLEALEHMSGGSAASSYLMRHGGLTEFLEDSVPYLVKDISACREQAAEIGFELGLLGRVADEGPIDLT